MLKFENLLINLTHQNNDQKEINGSRMNLVNACCHLFQYHLPNSLLPKKVKIKIHKNISLHCGLYGCETWSYKGNANRLRVFDIRVQRMISGVKSER